jgi:hypothetical protein
VAPAALSPRARLARARSRSRRPGREPDRPR